MKCSVFIAASVDGYIAKADGNIDWMHSAGNQHAEMGEQADMGFAHFFATVDCLIMGRKTMDVIAAMDIPPEQWPYGEVPIIVLSHTLAEAPKSLRDKVEVYAGELPELIGRLEAEGYSHAYVDGGTAITSFIKQRLINDVTITRVPLLLGDGISLFGVFSQEVALENAEAVVFPNDFIQVKYSLRYR